MTVKRLALYCFGTIMIVTMIVFGVTYYLIEKQDQRILSGWSFIKPAIDEKPTEVAFQYLHPKTKNSQAMLIKKENTYEVFLWDITGKDRVLKIESTYNEKTEKNEYRMVMGSTLHNMFSAVKVKELHYSINDFKLKKFESFNDEKADRSSEIEMIWRMMIFANILNIYIDFEENEEGQEVKGEFLKFNSTPFVKWTMERQMRATAKNNEKFKDFQDEMLFDLLR